MSSADAMQFPDSMRQIVDAIGKDAALALAKAYGGSKVWIPVVDRLVEAHPVAQLLGLEDAMKLAAIAGGSRLNIPLCQSVNDALVDDDMLKRWRNDESARQIARAHGMTERAVFRRLARLRAAAK